MKLRASLLWIGMLFAAALFAACGEGGKEESGGESPGPATPPRTELPAGLTGVGSRWAIELTLYSRGWTLGAENWEDKIKGQYRVQCEVVGEGGTGDGAYWVVEMRRDPCPTMFGAAYRLHVMKRVPELLHIEVIGQREATADFKLLRPDQFPFLFGLGLPSLPVEFPGGLDKPGTVEHQVAGSRLKVRRTVTEKPDSVEVLLEVLGGLDHTIRQVWDKNLRWWSLYEQTIDGHQDLVARPVAP